MSSRPPTSELRRAGSAGASPPSSGPTVPPPSSARGRPSGKFTQHKRMSELRQLLMQHPKGFTLEEIAGHLHVTERSARRYLAEISFDLEYDADRTSGQKRWRIPAVDLPRRVAMRRTQAYALLAARPLFSMMAGATLYEEIDLAAQTLLAVARRPGRGPNAGVRGHLEERFCYVPFAPKDYSEHAEDLDAIFQAVADLRALSCRYPRASDGELERKVVHPLALVLYKDAIFCIAKDAQTTHIAALALDGVRGARTLDDTFTIPEDFRLEDYVQGQFGLWRAEGELHEVVVDLHSSVADNVLTRTVHPTQRVDAIDGGVRLSFEIGDLTEVVTWVLGFGSLANVVGPPALRERVADELERALSSYSAARG